MRIPGVCLAMALALVAACADQGESIAGIPRSAADGLYPQIVVTGAKQPSAEVRLSLLRKPAGMLLGSYQGELTFDASVLRLEGASLPEGVDGATWQVSPGRIRFVGTALDGVREVPLITLRFTRLGEVRAGRFSVAFEEVTGAEDLSDLTAQVQSGAPIITLLDH